MLLALFGERAQEEAFATRPFLAPAPLAPTGRGVPTGEGIRLTGRWSWATGVMHGNWIIVGHHTGAADKTDLFIMRTDGSGVRNFTNTPQISDTAADWGPA